ncbi:hypothetical protein JCM3774_006401 [Rhodotorula dairenensis]
MTTKRTKSVAATSSPRRPRLRARKRQKVSTSHSRAGSRTLDSDGDRQDASDDTDSDYEDELSDDHGTRPTRRRTSAPSAGAVAGNRNAAARRASLQHRAQGTSRTRATDGPARTRKSAGEDAVARGITQQPRIPTRGGSRTVHPLSPLPVNHAVERKALDKGKGKERAREDDGGDASDADQMSRRKPREASASARSKSAVHTRHLSGSANTSPPSSQDTDPRQRVLRRSRRRSSRTQIDYDEEGQEDLAAHAGPSTAVFRNRRRTRSDSLNELEPIDDTEEGAEPEAASSGETDLEAKLYTWSPDELRSLRVAELVDLVQRLYADAEDGPHPRTKDQSIQAILAARPPGTDSDASEHDDGRATPYPRTSHENSSEGGDSSTDSQRDMRTAAAYPASAVSATPRRRIPARRVGVRRQEPTPPPSASDDDGDAESGEGDATETEDDTEQTPRATTSNEASTAMARRSSEVEMPPPPLPPRRPAANGTPTLRVATGPSALAGFYESFGGAGTAPIPGATPVARRTRGQIRPTKLTSPPPQGSSQGLQLQRTLFGQKYEEKSAAGANLVGSDDTAMAHERDHDGDSGSDSDGGSQGYNSGGESVGPNGHARRLRAPARRADGARTADGQSTGRRRSGRTVKQVITPPSDADEESGGETEHESNGGRPRRGKGDGTVEATSHQRQTGRALRHDKVVRLSRVRHTGATTEDVEMQDGAHSDDDDADEYEPDESEENQADEVDLSEATGPMLMRYRKDDLVRLCEERDIDHDGRKKAQLVDALLQWRDMDVEASSPVSAASSAGSTLSNLSTDTARQETKTQALKAADHASKRQGSSNRPLLMRSHHSASPEKPQTPEHSKVHEHQEDVNALDLESLQLQDKEIPPEQLEKLERIGSGGFKDVYKGRYRKRTIAICEIRGHLTDMDIKELGLLRDLHHKNVVQFIGISLPKQPSHIPVMIITELCANGDLFDYIRKTDPPPFTAMLDIMLGIARGIEYLHLHKPAIIHRDIKSSNVLISAQGVAKIADFGLARIKNSTQSMIRSLVGTVNWQAPELWHPHPRYNEKVDVYSAALVYWEVLQWHQPVKRYPFEGQNEHAIYHDVGAKNLRPPPGPLRRQWGGEIVDLMESMWVQDPAQRPSMTKVAAQLEKLKRDKSSSKPTSKERR